jgi:hypothetical protein
MRAPRRSRWNAVLLTIVVVDVGGGKAEVAGVANDAVGPAF